MTALHKLDTLTVGDLTLSIAPPTERTTLQITVDRDASLILRAPQRATKKQAVRFVESKKGWLYRKLAEKDALVGPPVVKDFVDGEGFAYLGRSHRLLLDDAAEGVRLDRGRFVMSSATTRLGSEAMRRWYTATGQPWLHKRSVPWVKRLDLNDVDISVLDLGFRWGSAGTNGINIHWATLQLPPSLIDYVLAHELAHLRHPNHTPEFWTTLSTAMPDYESRKETLRVVGRAVWLGTARADGTKRSAS